MPVYLDTETRSALDVTRVGAHKYARDPSTQVIVLTYAIAPSAGDVTPDDVRVLARGPTTGLRWADLPADLRRAVEDGEEMWAWNADFDEQVMIHCGVMPGLEPGRILDASGWARANRLPGRLADAARAVGSVKLATGKGLIRLFSDAAAPIDLEGDPKHADAWRDFLAYAAQDVVAMCDVLATIRPPLDHERIDCRVAAIINDRGLPIDVPAARTAARLADEYADIARRVLVEITGDPKMTPGAHLRFRDWVLARVGHIDGASDALASRWRVDPDTGERRPIKYSVDREHAGRLMDLLADLDDPVAAQVLGALKVRQHAAGTSAKKFARLVDMADADGRLRGAYVWNGAETGRYSSRGAQMHNMTRASIGLEGEAQVLDKLRAGTCTLDDLADYSDDADAADTLGKLVRPMIRAPEGWQMVWGDWSAIEARALPWLAGDLPGAAETVRVFAASDADPDAPDIYEREASGALGVPLDEVDKAKRQIGKVIVLALGYCGGVGALDAMAKGYGVTFRDEATKQRIVDRFRERNPWVQAFGQGLLDALIQLHNDPSAELRVGRVTLFATPAPGGVDAYLILPDGRPLRYPGVRWGRYTTEDKQTGEPIEQEGWVFQGRGSLVPLWPGLLAENATQGTAGSLLRHTLRRLVLDGTAPDLVVVGHTHDEIIGMARDGRSAAAEAQLLAAMQAVPGWADGLPLAAETARHRWYSKAVG